MVQRDECPAAIKLQLSLFFLLHKTQSYGIFKHLLYRKDA